MSPARLAVALAAAAGGGLLMNLAFPRHSVWWLAVVGLALLLGALRGASPGRGFLIGAVWGAAFHGPFLTWAVDAVLGQRLPWLALTLLQAGWVGLFGLLYAFVMGRRAARGKGALVAALLWVAVEQLRALWPFGGFPWGLVAFSQEEGPLLRLAALGGTVLVSLVVVLLAYALLAAATGWRHPAPSAAAVVGAALAVAATSLIPLPTAPQAGELTVAVVQGSVPTRGGEALGQARAITANYRALAEGMAGEPMDLMVWPESAADLDPREHDDVAADVRAAQRAVGVPLLLGTQRYEDDTRYNEYLLWLDDGPAGVYAKQHPVPFGEYIPHRDFFRRLSAAVDLVSTDMAQGSAPAIMSVPVDRLGRAVPIGVGICFEVAYDDLIREGVELGAELIVIPTNNASFGFTQEGAQQLAISRFRAVEQGRATIQVATTGVSGVFLPDGSVVARSGGLYEEWTAVETLPLRTDPTVATLLGTWPRLVVWAVAAAWIVLAAVSSADRGRRPRRSEAALPERTAAR